jgi:PhnB protein
MAVASTPDGYGGVTPYLIVNDADRAIAWYGEAFGARCLYRMAFGGKVGHAELALASGHVMLADEFPDMGFLSPTSRGGGTVSMLFYVPDVDAAMANALAAGATTVQPLSDQPWGDRSCQLLDPFGHRWTLATHIEDVSYEELDRRIASWQPPEP